MPYLFRFDAAEIYSCQLQAMQNAAGACRPLYPCSKREMPGDILQDLFRKAEQTRNLQCTNFISDIS